MHAWVFQLAIVWLVAVAIVLALFALRARFMVERALALEVLSLAVVAALALVSIRREDAGYLDVALVIALLGFVQAVATARFVEWRRENA